MRSVSQLNMCSTVRILSGRTWLVGIGGAAVVLALLWIGVRSVAYYVRGQAERLTSAIHDLPMGAVSLDEANRQVEHHTGLKGRYTNLDDGERYLVWELVTPQADIREPGKIFSINASLEFDGSDRLVRKIIALSSNDLRCCMVNITQYNNDGASEGDGVYLSRYSQEVIAASIYANSSGDEQQEAWQWNYACLTATGGCNDARAILPLARISAPRGKVR